MDVRCDKCQARYRVDDARVGPQGLTMRCGKCSNTFKVTKENAAAPAAPSPAPETNATMMFAAPVLPKPGAPPAAKPPPTPPAAKLAGKPAAAVADEAAGRTMMFGPGLKPAMPSAPAKPPMPAATPAKAAVRPADDSGSTMVFGSAPVLPATPSMPKAASKPAAGGEDSGSTMVFGSAPVPAAARPAAAKPAPVPAPPNPGAPAKAPQPEPQTEEQEAAASDSADLGDDQQDGSARSDEQRDPSLDDEGGALPEDGPEPLQARPGERLDGDANDDVATTGESEPPAGAFEKPPPKGLLIGVAACIGVLLLAGAGVFAAKKLGKKPPPAAAVEALGAAQTAMDKDTFKSLADAEAQTKAALDQAAGTSFPQAWAQLAEVDIAWSDALNDQAAQLEKKASTETDEKKKSEAEAKASEMQAQSKTRLKAAFEAIGAGVKADKLSPDVTLALADYYRAQRSSSNMTKQLRAAQKQKADAGRASFIEGAALQAEDEGAEKALPKLKAAEAAAPQSARVHFRVALDELALHQEAEAMKELKETLRISPGHERAKLAMELLAVSGGGASADVKSGDAK